MPDSPGTSGLVIDLDGAAIRIVASHATLPGGYHFLMGRESARFLSLVNLFWYGVAGAAAMALALGAMLGWMARRALLAEVQEISRAATAIVGGGPTRRVAVHTGSDELTKLAQLVSEMLGQMATSNVQLVNEIAVRRKAELALHSAHAELEAQVAQRTTELANANESLRRSEIHLGEAQRLSLTCSFGWNVPNGPNGELVWSEATYDLMGIDRWTRAC